MSDTKLTDEMGRRAALRRYEILDTPREAPFDRIVNLVKTVMDVPVALISLVDADRQWLKSCLGVDLTETSRDISFCTYTIQAREPLMIPNASEDPRFANNPLVLGPPHIMSYLGVPLATPDGYNLGSLCAIDTKPRTFNAGQIEVM
jgi:GAF domain-containing protein